MIYLSYILNMLLVAAFIADRLFRIRSAKEFKEAKEAQIDNLRQQLESERRNNDIEITEMHRKRYESLKVLLDEKESEINSYSKALSELKSSLESAKKDADLKGRLSTQLLEEVNRVERQKHDLEVQKKALLLQIGSHRTAL